MSLLNALNNYDNDQLLYYLEEEIVVGDGNHEEVFQMMETIDSDYCDERTVPCTSLQLAINKNKPEEVILKLMDIGGRDLIMMKAEYGYREWTALHYACSNENPSMEIISKLLELGGRELLMGGTWRGGYTALHSACSNENHSMEIISKLLELGGTELLMVDDRWRSTALHSACSNENPSIEIISKLIELGGRELLMEAHSRYGNTALHNACLNENPSIEIISKLLELGGTELLMMHGEYTGTALHSACSNENPSIEIISKLLELGGRELLMIHSEDIGTALHSACSNKNPSIEIISKLIELGGRELLMVTDRRRQTALHSAYSNENPSLEIISKLIKLGGRELLIAEVETYLDHHFTGWAHQHIFNDASKLLVKEFILANVGGEFGIGGIFNFVTETFGGPEVQNRIYERWDELSPILKFVVESLQDQQQPPILHSAILAKAPLRVIKNIINQFEYSVLKTDSLNRYPLVVGLEEGLGWNDGLQQLVEATTVAQQQHPRIPIYTAAQYGLKWTHHMKELVEANVDEIMNGHDSLTGLRLFMVAAMGNYQDLNGIYGMMRMSPETNNSV